MTRPVSRYLTVSCLAISWSCQAEEALIHGLGRSQIWILTEVTVGHFCWSISTCYWLYHWDISLSNDYCYHCYNSSTMLSLQSLYVLGVVVVGAVDDHFRKSLGAAWHSSPSRDSVPQPDSVDDHFARALGGDTWRRIKADHERSTSVPPYSSLHYYPT